MSLNDKPRLLFLYFLVCSSVVFYCYLKTKIIFFLVISIFVLVLNIFILIKSLKSSRKESDVSISNYFKVMGKIIGVSNEKIHGGFCIHVSYQMNEKEYQIKSKSLNYNPNKLIYMFQIKEIPVLVSNLDSNKAIVDDSYLNSYMEKRNSDANILFENFETNLKWIKKNQRYNYVYGILLLILSILLTIRNYISNLDNNPIGLYILTLITIFITYILFKKKISLIEKGIKLTGYIENIVYNPDISYNRSNTFRRPCYVISVSYIYNNKIYLTKSNRIYLKFSNKSSDFIPVYIDRNNPNISYVDISYLK